MNSEPSDPLSDRLSELLMHWEERKASGQPVGAAQLCADCPELIPELEEKIRAICSMEALLQGTEREEETILAGSTDARAAGRDPASSVELMQTVSKYHVVRSHARGGLGEVLVAHDESLGRDVALKVIQQPHDQDPDRRRRFIREAEITSRLEHPGIVPIHGIGQDSKGRLCYAMKLIAGETLQHAIRRFHHSPDENEKRFDKHLEFRKLLGRFISVCNAVAYAHDQGFLHRDLKPANIMLGAFGETLVVDWGLAKKCGTKVVAGKRERQDSPGDATAETVVASTDHGPSTRLGQAIGTPAFMSPEQSRGEWDQLGPPSDIYSLGATLYALITGKSPYEGMNLQQMADARERGTFPTPRQIKADVSKPLEAICLKAMALRPEARYVSALELAADLEKFLADEPVSAYREPIIARGLRWVRRHRLLVTSGSAALFVATVSLGVLLAIVSDANETLRIANQKESTAKAAAMASAVAANKNAKIAEDQSDLALRSLQSVTFEIQRQLKNVPAAHRVRRQLLDTALKGLAEVAAKLEQRPLVDHGLMIAHRDLGDVFFEVGGDGDVRGTDAARTQFQLAFDIASSLANAKPDHREAKRQLAICHDRLGDYHARAGTTTEAEKHFSESLAIREQLAATYPGDHEIQRDIAVSHNRLGDLKLKSGKVEAARDLYLRALKITKELSPKRETTADNQRDLTLSYNKVGNVVLRLGDAKQALELYQLGLAEAKKCLALDVNSDIAKRDLSTSYDRLASASSTLGDFEKAAEYYRQSLEICEQRRQLDPANAQVLRDVMQASEFMADALAQLGKHAEAKTHNETMVSIAEHLLSADPTDARAMRDLALAYTGLADRFVNLNDLPGAVEWYRKSVDVRKQRADALPDEPRAKSDLAFGLTKLGDGLMAVDEVDAALAIYSDALQIHRERADANPTDRVMQSNLAGFLQRIGVGCRRAGQFEEAAGYYQQALQIAERLCESDPNDIPARIRMLNFYHSLGYLEQSRQKFADARRWYERGLTMAKELSDAGKLVGDDATWVTYIEDAICECDVAESQGK